MRVFILSALVALDLAMGLPAAAGELVRVVDGDTFILDGRRMRLFGVDAPERDQVCADANGESYRCGERAAAALRELVSTGPLECDGKGHDVYERLLVVCRVAGRDLNAALVASGWAVAYRWRNRPTVPEYLPAESDARAARRGLWVGQFVMPWDWRAARRRRD